MKTKIRYTVVSDKSEDRLAYKVCELINKGCVPIGGISYGSNYKQSLWIPDDNNDCLGYYDEDVAKIYRSV